MPTGQTYGLLALTVLGGLFLFLHALNLWHGLTARELPVGVRLLALLPPAAPVLAWRGGRRAAPVLWASVLLAYLAIRAFV